MNNQRWRNILLAIAALAACGALLALWAGRRDAAADPAQLDATPQNAAVATQGASVAHAGAASQAPLSEAITESGGTAIVTIRDADAAHAFEGRPGRAGASVAGVGTTAFNHTRLINAAKLNQRRLTLAR